MKRTLMLFIPLFIFIFSGIPGSAAQADPHPTPIVINLSATPAPASPTPDSGLATPLPGSLSPDRFETNDTAETASQIGFQVETGLTLTAGDVDFYTGFAKAGQWLVVSTAVYGGLDTIVTLFWAGSASASNDDRSGLDLGSQVIFQAPAAGWYTLQVQSVAGFSGQYDLTVALTEPTATATPWPTTTPLPTATPFLTASPQPTATPLAPPDLAEPNNGREGAYGIVPEVTYKLSLGQGDIDYFTFIGKAGSAYACETMTPHIDTLLTVLVAGELVGTNDDRSPQRLDSYLTWQMATEQPVMVEVQARSGATGSYDLICTSLLAASTAPLSPGTAPALASITDTVALTETAALSTTLTSTGLPAGAVPLSIWSLGPEIPPEPAVQEIQLVVYYDSNNDQKPSPGEGIAHVSVLAVDANGQHLARVFTNTGGEAIFTTTDKRIDRLVVPFVSDWSVKVQPGRPESLGLPAVRIPVFLPVGLADNAR